MAIWSQKIANIEVDGFVIPAVVSSWHDTGAWIAYIELNPYELGKRIPRNHFYNLRINLYSPRVKFNLSAGELEKIGIETEKILDKYTYNLDWAELIGKSYRKMFTGTLIAYIIALVAAYGWWFIWFRQPFHALVGIDNWWKNLQAGKLPNYHIREVTFGKDALKQSAVDEVYRYFKSLKGRYLDICRKMRDYCKLQKMKNPAFEKIEKAYREIILSELEDSFLVKMVAHTLPQKVVRFFLGDMVLIPKVPTPRIIVPVRDLDYDLSFCLESEDG
ncbi:hypothetical protein DRJ04_03920 [Candidatus Aerophobetes bacterium]|uniref:Uncharacterized protein n=1 Tax=Aerophobetes bacterium TaxID=2030807 RepID=A0A662DD06_UNCAE|nr:MAG: hypothetical protein DRJ04_03920 [Candidatus Aerophobetes bacterium]